MGGKFCNLLQTWGKYKLTNQNNDEQWNEPISTRKDTIGVGPGKNETTVTEWNLNHMW